MRQEVQRPETGGAARHVRAGEMTSVMRAVATATGRKILRIGLVERGKVSDERVMRERTDVTVGPTEKSTFVVLTNRVPPKFKLFERVGDGYVLNVVEGMTGRIALDTRIANLDELCQGVRPVRQGAAQCYPIRLTEAARGRVTLGETTFLFQFVAAPLAQAKPQLPLSVRTGFGIDWTTTVIAAISFLFHFGLVGAIYSDWLDPMLDENITVAQLIDQLNQLPPPPPVEDKLAEAPTSTAVATSAPTSAPSTAAKLAGTSSKSNATGGHARSSTDARNAQIGDELTKLNVQMLATLNADGPSTDVVLERPDNAAALIDEAAKSQNGVGRNIAGLNLGGDAAYNGRPGESGRNGLIADAHRGDDGPASTGKTKDVKPPAPPQVSAGAAVKGGTVANAGQVVAGLAGAFRRCYEAGLRDNPDMRGKFNVTAKIGAGGEVLSAVPSGGGGTLSGAVMGCAAQRVQGAQFSAPDGGGATIVIPIGMDHQ